MHGWIVLARQINKMSLLLCVLAFVVEAGEIRGHL